MAKNVTMRGKVIDVHKLMQQNATKPALGNASVNARGDLINKKGIVLKTQEEIEEIWARAKAQQESLNKSTDIKQSLPIPTVKQLDVSDNSFEPEITNNTKKTKKTAE